jgi:uncharacterized cupredoxin-like copper-binding protein
MKRILFGFSALLVAVSATIALAAPGHDGGHAHSAVGKAGDPKKVSRTIEVVMNDQMRFLPDKVTVKPGETIRFVVKNVGEIKHEMMLGTKKELMEHAKVMQQHPGMEHDDDNAVTLEPGKTGEIVWQFTRAGTFMFGCLMPGHVEAGMVGSISVRR